VKLAILGDCHFGMRNDMVAFHDYYRKFYQEVFFPYLRENNITKVIQTGDLFDRRKFINFNSLYLARQYFFNEFGEDSDLSLITYIGNHDIYYKNTLEINSSKMLITNFATVIEKPITQNFGSDLSIDIIPWICEDNEQEIKEFIAKSTSKVCFGHFEIKGFEMDRGYVCTGGIDRESLSKYNMVITGHFHHRSTDGHIFYVGSPGEMTWADYGDRRGFHIFDTETLDLDFIENPFSMFHKVVYNDDQNSVSSFGLTSLESVQNKDFSKFANTMVKVVVAHKDNPVLFDHFMDALYKVHPLDVTIVEDFTDYSQYGEDDVINQADSTTDILDKYVDSIEVGLDKGKMKTLLREVYTQALDNDIL
jgi:DNA repair exonuclease SbcCD nuclease subunit